MNESPSISETLGSMIRILRHEKRLSLEALSSKAGITYQYLSSLENGKENFTLNILESLSNALEIPVPRLVLKAYRPKAKPSLLDRSFVIPQSQLPHGLKHEEVLLALEKTQEVIKHLNATLLEEVGKPLSSLIQRNNYGAVVSNLLCDCMSQTTNYKHNHHQEYPDLISKQGKRAVGLEIKSTIRPGKGGESHNGHSGWHMVACFRIDECNGDIFFIHVMFADLNGHTHAHPDWKRLGSKINPVTGSHRTETYNTTPSGTAKLRHGTMFIDTDHVSISRWRTSREVKAPVYSLFKSRSGK